jgi:flagellar biosynthesis/type III secretory pathway chaperone
VDSGACRESLATLLSQEVSTLDELASLLEREHALLVANDVETLEKAMEERQVTLGLLLRIEDERRSLCRTHGRSTDLAGLEALLAWCDPRGMLKAQWAECAQGATRCRELNDKNGALVHARMKRVETLLGALTGQPAAAPTYGPKGAYTMPRSGRVLATEA